MPEIRYSACVIVKNEAANLPHWLACMRELADEMIVVDTGSTDDSVAIAEAGGARVCHFAWCDDFAAAKNYAIAQARGRWLLMLDADEYIAPEDYPILRRAWAAYDHRADILGFMSQWINIDVDNHNRRKNSSFQIRIFRRLPQLRYRGAIHEALVYTGPGRGQRQMQLIPDLVIWHTGYSAHIIRQKAERNMEIILARQKKEGEQPLDDGYLADCYYTLRDYEKTAYHAARAAQKEEQAVGRETRNYALWIQSLSLLGRPRDEVEAAVAQAEAAHPLVPDYPVISGHAAWRRGASPLAVQLMQQGLVRYEQFLAHKQDVTATIDDEMAGLLPQVLCYLATAAHWQGRDEEALACLEQGLAVNRYHTASARLYLRLLRHAEPVDVISRLGRFYDKRRDAAYLLGLLPASLARVYLYYARQAGLTLREGEQYRLAGRLPAASAALREDVTAASQLAILALAHGAPSPVAPLLSAAYDPRRPGRAAQAQANRSWVRMQRLPLGQAE